MDHFIRDLAIKKDVRVPSGEKKFLQVFPRTVMVIFHTVMVIFHGQVKGMHTQMFNEISTSIGYPDFKRSCIIAPKWKADNCAEPRSLIFLSLLQGRARPNIKAVATFRPYKIPLEDMPRCAICKETRKRISPTHILTDIDMSRWPSEIQMHIANRQPDTPFIYVPIFGIELYDKNEKKKVLFLHFILSGFFLYFLFF